MKVIITGATGMIGRGVLLECLDDDRVEKVLAIVRTPTGEQHPKLKELFHADFSNFESVREHLKGYDACYATMGVSAAGTSEEKYTHLTYTMTLALAETLHAINPDMTFTYVSGVGTDSTEKGKTMWARVKGKTENDLMKLGFKKAIMFRPGVIKPLRGIRSKTKMYQFMYDYFMWMINLVELISPDSITDTTRIGRAMINAHERGEDGTILTPKDINALSSRP